MNVKRLTPLTGNRERRTENRRLAIAAAALFWIAVGAGAASDTVSEDDDNYAILDAPQHDYWNRPLKDPFTLFNKELEAGRIQLDTGGGEKAYLVSLLKALAIPASSQMLVYSTTSLQLRFISPRNPRAIYFNEDVYLGYIPGGRIEIVSLDPELGGIYYIFDIPGENRPPVVERSDRCMNCHAAEDTRNVPGIAVKSVIPGTRGGSLNSFRREQTGHGIAFEERFGGWHVTGEHGIKKHFGNLIGEMRDGKIATQPLEPGAQFDFGKYPVATSDILPHLLFEHQAGFVNRFVEASYRTRTLLREDKGMLSQDHAKELNEIARELTRYLLFADEAPLPKPGIGGDEKFKADFLEDRKAAADGRSLKDFDLSERLFRYRCSYMIYSGVFQGLPGELKKRVYLGLKTVLGPKGPPEFSWLPPSEKKAIREILKETLTDLPADW